MKNLTRSLYFIAIGLIIASFVNLDVIVGLVAVGIFAFLFIYDDGFRRMF